MSVREGLRIWKEATWGVFANPSSPVLHEDFTWIDLDTANAAGIRATPNRWQIRSARGYNRRVQTGSDQVSVGGAINTVFYASQAEFLLTGLLGVVATDLPSYSIDHYLLREDGTYYRRRYLGCKFAQGTLSATAQAQLFRLALTVVGRSPAPDPDAAALPIPADALFPNDPYTLSDLTAPGSVTLGAARTEFGDFSLTVKNILDATHRPGPYVSRIKYCGRDVDMALKFVYVNGTDRADFEATAAKAASLRLDNGAKHVLLDFNERNFIEDLSDDIDHGKVFEQGMKWANYFDGAAGDDLALTFGTTP